MFTCDVSPLDVYKWDILSIEYFRLIQYRIKGFIARTLLFKYLGYAGND
jgi:hypothetical protein